MDDQAPRSGGRQPPDLRQRLPQGPREPGRAGPAGGSANRSGAPCGGAPADGPGCHGLCHISRRRVGRNQTPRPRRLAAGPGAHLSPALLDGMIGGRRRRGGLDPGGDGPPSSWCDPQHAALVDGAPTGRTGRGRGRPARGLSSGSSAARPTAGTHYPRCPSRGTHLGAAGCEICRTTRRRLRPGRRGSPRAGRTAGPGRRRPPSGRRPPPARSATVRRRGDRCRSSAPR